MRIQDFLKTKERLALSVFGLVVGLIWLSAMFPRHQELKVTFLSVGQGDSAVIRTPSGRTVLIDAGPGGDFDAGSKVVVPFLRREGVNTIDSFIISHPHEDHIGGAMSVVRNFKISCLLDSGVVHPSGIYRDLLEAVDEKHIPYQRVSRGQVIDFHDGVTMEVLNPPPGTEASDEDKNINNTSVVIKLKYKNAAFLFCGDAEKEAEANILSTDTDVSCQVIKVAHHGSPNATTYPWISATKPKIGIISVGWKNPFGHPSPKTIKRLEESGVQVYRTDQCGGITVTTDGEKLTVDTTRTPSGG